MLKPRVSVALCTYNGAAFIERQLETILKQSRPPDEVVVSDDGSTDHTVAIVKRMADRFPSKLRLERTAGRLGYAKNFEFTIQQATGDIIFLSDQDDVWLEHKIERMLIPFAASERVAVVYCDAHLAGRQLEPRGRSVFGARASMHLATRRSARELVKGVDIGVLGSMMAIRASLKRRVMPIEEVWGHDHWIVFIAHAIAEVRAVNEPLMYYRRHPGNTGFDSKLDGSQWKDWVSGILTTGLEPYSRETRRWRVMVQKLRSLRASDICFTDIGRLDEFIRESESRLEFARVRESLKRERSPRRLRPTLRLLLSGSYHYYAHGLRSFCKDLLLL
jgi:glycosyltransferase involved in cell wall biosynthesis